jgi:hypothetical protein
MRNLILCITVVLTLGVVLGQGQVTPVVAKQRILQDVLDSKGNVVNHSETLGRYLRNSEGSTITQTYSSSSLGGKLTIQAGQLEDYRRQQTLLPQLRGT